MKKDAEDFATRTANSIESSDTVDLDRESEFHDVGFEVSPTMEDRISAIVAAVWRLAELAAKQDKHNPVFFLNESWTVVPDTVELGSPGLSSGIVVAAAGNTPGKEVNSDTGKIDFARNATPANDVLAALDTKPGLNQPFCDSSQLNRDTLSMTMAAAYDGEAVDGGLCGTSFSAPRIAWLLALGKQPEPRICSGASGPDGCSRNCFQFAHNLPACLKAYIYILKTCCSETRATAGLISENIVTFDLWKRV